MDPRSLVSATPIPLLRGILRWRVVEAILSLVLGSSPFQCVHTQFGPQQVNSACHRWACHANCHDLYSQTPYDTQITLDIKHL